MSEEPTLDDYLKTYLPTIKQRIDKLEKWKENQENIDKAMRFEINKNIPKLQETILKDLGIESINKEMLELKEKITWLSEENAKLYTQLDNDALKRATNTEVLRELYECLISDRIPNKPKDWDLLMIDKFRYLLKRLSGATDVRSAAHTEKPSYGCFLFTYCSECIISYDDCKVKGIQQVVVEQKDLKNLDSTLSNERFESPDTIESIIRMGQAWDKFKEKYLGGKEE